MLTLAVIAKHNAMGFRRLIDRAVKYVDQIIVAVDENPEDGIWGYMPNKVEYFLHPLNKDFSAQRNFLCELATQEWILHLDTDENLDLFLWERLGKQLRRTRQDLILLPRANYTEGISKHPEDWINWPDWQPKLHRRHVRWHLPVHEWPVGHKSSKRFPEEVRYAIIHRKTSEDQEKATAFYATIKPSR